VETADHSRQGLQLMKRFAPIAAIAVGSLLLVGCESRVDRNTHICALYYGKNPAFSLEELEEELGLVGRSDVGAYEEGSGWNYCKALLGLRPDEDL